MLDVNNLTSEIVLEADITTLADIVSEAWTFTYTLTSPELGWLEFVRGRYAIADLLYSAMIPEDEGGPVRVTLNSWDVSDALNSDDSDRPVMLSEDTALCRLCWVCYREVESC